MRKLAWAARGISAVSGAVLLGALMVPSAVAADGPAKSSDGKKKCGPVSRDISTAAPDFVNFPSGVVFHVATDRKGHAFVNDSRNPGVWVNLGLLANAPKCVVDTAASVTEANPGYLYITLQGHDGVIHQARCTTDNTPFAPATIVGACGAGFSELANTPV
ncbi:hypothetical protein OOK31_32205 [Streptomyces sp. NBC_00249]|uniref:hypothetical protein n=1 Tax=Streptomyces sp. NBC_00249 TaxID=2975690 RepID=UPI00225AEE9C|nr:hypothetical protein [Streptomyces sp. NBC_00249]MCX5198495.1 hypothetical protein [Streptomyces sp. NBC_00249]